MNRYKLARARSPERLQELLREDADLLAHFGMTLTAVESGVSMVPTRVMNTRKRINPWDVVNVNMSVWEWMLPLLDELRSRRLEGSLTSGNGRVDHVNVNVSELAAK
jgi:hypothetical protein